MQGDGRAARRWKSPDYWKCSAFASSKAKPRTPLNCRSPCRVGVAQVFLADSSSAWLPCALHRAGLSGCKFSVRLRLGGFRICLRQLCKRCLSVLQLLFHLAGSFLQLWLLQGGGLQCSRQRRVRVPAVLPGFSHAAAPWLCCSFIPSQRLHALLRRGQTL